VTPAAVHYAKRAASLRLAETLGTVTDAQREEVASLWDALTPDERDSVPDTHWSRGRRWATIDSMRGPMG